MSTTPDTTTAPEVPTGPTKEDLALLEVLAFKLSHAISPEANHDGKTSLESWQGNKELRATARQLAQGFVADLLTAGVEVRLKRLKTAEKFIEQINTIPSKPAYALGEE